MPFPTFLLSNILFVFSRFPFFCPFLEKSNPGKKNNIFEKRKTEKLRKNLGTARRATSTAMRRINSLEVECEDLRAALAEADVANKTVEEVDLPEAVDDFVIREGGRGRPVAEHFVQHVRCLMTTGSSARS